VCRWQQVNRKCSNAVAIGERKFANHPSLGSSEAGMR
jgi:hypothetical protein